MVFYLEKMCDCVKPMSVDYTSKLRCVLHIIIFLLFIIAGVAKDNSNNYGPYVLRWGIFEACKGPKQAECGKFEVETAENKSDIIFLLDFPRDCPATMAKVVVSTQTNNVTKRFLNYVLSKPCEHFVLGPILVESFNLTKSCKVNKGRYHVHLDFTAKAKMFLGTNFFYGTYVFQTMSYNRVNNFFCVKTVIEIKKP